MDSSDPRMALLQKWNDEGLLAKAGFMNSSELGREMTLDAPPNKSVSVAHVMQSLRDAGVNHSQMSVVEGKLHKSHGGGKKGKTKALLNQLLSLLGKKREKHNHYDTPDKSLQELEMLLNSELVKLTTEVREATEILKSAGKNKDKLKLPPGMNDAISKMIQAWIMGHTITDQRNTMNRINEIIEGYLTINKGIQVKNPYTFKLHENKQYNHANVASKILSFVTRYIGTNWKGDEKKNSLYLQLKTELKKLGKTQHTITLLSQAISNKKHVTHSTQLNKPQVGSQAWDTDHSFSISSPFE